MIITLEKFLVMHTEGGYIPDPFYEFNPTVQIQGLLVVKGFVFKLDGALNISYILYGDLYKVGYHGNGHPVYLYIIERVVTTIVRRCKHIWVRLNTKGLKNILGISCGTTGKAFETWQVREILEWLTALQKRHIHG